MLILSTTRYTTDQPEDEHLQPRTPFGLLQPLRRWLSEREIRDRNLARMLCVLIPARCPFERTFQFRGRTILSIPPLCKLNPFYDELVVLRFRSLCYLAEVLDEDISRFC